MLVKESVLVQSKKYKWHLPIGNIEQSAIQYEYFDIDEFLLISLDGMEKSCIDTALLGRLREVTSYPITYAGGVSSLEQVRIAFDGGADRVVVNRLLNQRVKEVEKIANLVGRQGIVGSFDITIDKVGDFFVRTCESIRPLNIDHIVMVSSIVGEINLGIIDWEGSIEPKYFEKINPIVQKIIQKIDCPITLYGGSSWFNYDDLDIGDSQEISVMVDNILSYKEDSVNEFSEKLKSM